MTEHIANREQAEAWDGAQGDHWVRYADHFDTRLQQVTPPLLRAGAIGVSDRVLDVGCGSGSTTRMAARAAPAGSVVGVDLSAALLQEAERRSRAEGLDNVRFEQADMQVHAFAPPLFDLAISRFGVMFFENPVAAFSNIASALRPHGRFVFMCWQERDRNEWVTVPVSAALGHVPLPAPAPEGTPGAFSLTKPERICQLLADAGFENLDLDEIVEPIFLGDDAGVASQFWQGTGTARVLLDDVDADTERRAMDAVRGAFREHEAPGGIWLPSAAWLVSATRA